MTKIRFKFSEDNGEALCLCKRSQLCAYRMAEGSSVEKSLKVNIVEFHKEQPSC